MPLSMLIPWLMVLFICYHSSNSDIGGWDKGVAEELTESLLGPPTDRTSSDISPLTEGVPLEGRVMTSDFANHWLFLMRHERAQALSDWLILYRIRKIDRYPIHLEDVPFLGHLKNSYETHAETQTAASEEALFTSINAAFAAASRMEENTADSQIKIGTLMGVFAEITQVEKDRPDQISQRIEEFIRPQILALQETKLTNEKSAPRRLADELLKLWCRRNSDFGGWDKGVAQAMAESHLGPPTSRTSGESLPSTESVLPEGHVITSDFAKHWLSTMRHQSAQFLSDWLMLYRLQKTGRYPIHLEDVPFLGHLKNSHETHVETQTPASKDALIATINAAFAVVSRIDESTADSQIKTGTLMGILAEITQVERDIPDQESQLIEDFIRPQILALQQTKLKIENSVPRRLADELLKLWSRRNGKA